MQTKKKVLIGGLSSLAVAAGVALTGGTSAYFYDLENSAKNSIGACSLDLVADQPAIVQTANGSVGGSPADITISGGPQSAGLTVGAGTAWEDTTVGGLYKVGIGGMEPGDAFKVTIPVRNRGECVGELWGDIRGPFEDSEGDKNYEPEDAWQAAGNDPDQLGVADDESAKLILMDGSLNPGLIDQYDGGAGDLDNFVEVYYGPDWVGNQTPTGETFSDFAWRKPMKMEDTFGPGGTRNIVVNLVVPDNGAPGYGNEIMGDSFEFLIDLALAQPGKLTSSNTSGGLHDVTPAP